MIVFSHDPAGAFIAGDTVTGATCYAYPTSDHATKARRFPDLIAAVMMDGENGFRAIVKQSAIPQVAEYDSRNWGRLGTQPVLATV